MGHRSTKRAKPTGAISRRDWLQLASLGVVGGAHAGWFEALAARAAADPQRRRSCILLWMSGGPSQIDTFDPKPGHANGGPFKAIATRVPGLQIAEHLPKLAEQAEHLAIIRSLTSKEGDHARATQFVHTGYLPQGPIRYPTLGSLVSKELGSAGAELPNFVSVSPFRALSPASYSPGFLGSQFAPLLVDGRPAAANGAAAGEAEVDAALKVEDLELPKGVDLELADTRLDLLRSLNDSFVAEHADAPAVGHATAYQRAVKLMRSAAGRAFNLDEEPAAVRDAYGRNRFGQGCLLARRLVEQGVPFVEVTLGNGGLGWDSHADNFETVRKLSGMLDPAWATLIEDLRTRGLLDTTLIVWMGEFGRTPKINENTGRDHFPNAWSAVLAGGGIRGGQAYGRTADDAMSVADNPVKIPDLMATVCRALGIDPQKQNDSNLGRPIRIVDPAGAPIDGVLA
jgi:uncharacterized protein (DUF1501 family)